MTYWNKLLQLPPHVQAMEKLQKIYGNCFPLEIRQYLSGWLETQLINTHTSNVYNRLDIASSFFEQLLTQIEGTAAALSSYDCYTVKFRLMEAAKNLRQIYSSDPVQLYTHLQNCLEYERKLLANPMEQIDELAINTINSNNNNNNISNNKNDNSLEITQTLLKLQEKNQECEIINHSLKREYEDYNSLSDDFNKRCMFYDTCAREKPEQQAQIAMAKRQQTDHLMMVLNKIHSLRSDLLEKFKNTIDEAETILEMIKNNFLYKWMRQQKIDAVKYIGAQTDATLLDVVQGWYEKLADIFWKTFNIIKTIKNYQNDHGEMIEGLSKVEQKTLRLLENLIVTSFIVEKQPSQIIVQERNGGKKFSSTVRLLIGNILNSHFYNPLVTVSIISEHQAHLLKKSTNPSTLNFSTNDIVNSIGNLEYDSAKNQLSVEFKNMQLRKVKRNDKSGEDKIVDEKFALLFQTKINVGLIEFSVWAISLPVVVISNNKQLIDALATVIWDNSFSELHRVPFEEPDKVKWSQLAEVLSQKFEFSVGRGLTSENLHFLCEKILKSPIPYPIPDDIEVTRAQFCKNLLLDSTQPHNNFSFWKWFYSAMQLTHEHLKDQWNDGYVVGFIHKIKTENCLRHCMPGTFLLRFSESILGGLVVSWIDHRSINHLKPFLKSELSIRSITSCIQDLEFVSMLYDGYQGIPKSEAFKRYKQILNLPQINDNKSNYVERDFRITCERNAALEECKMEAPMFGECDFDMILSSLETADDTVDKLLNQSDYDTTSVIMDEFLMNSFQENLTMSIDSDGKKNENCQQQNIPKFNSTFANFVS